MKGVWLPSKIPSPLFFLLSLLCLDFLMWLVPGGNASAITFSLFPGRDSWSSFGSQQELSILHSLSLLCPLFLSPFHNCRLSVQENYLALMFKHLCKGQNEPSAHTPLTPGIALPWALLTWALKGPSEFLHIAVLHTAFIVTYEPYVQKTFDLFSATRMS